VKGGIPWVFKLKGKDAIFKIGVADNIRLRDHHPASPEGFCRVTRSYISGSSSSGNPIGPSVRASPQSCGGLA